MTTLRHKLTAMVADMWALRVPTEEAGRILGYNVDDWSRAEILQGLFDWKYDMLEQCSDDMLIDQLRLEQNYIIWRSKH